MGIVLKTSNWACTSTSTHCPFIRGPWTHGDVSLDDIFAPSPYLRDWTQNVIDAGMYVYYIHFVVKLVWANPVTHTLTEGKEIERTRKNGQIDERNR